MEKKKKKKIYSVVDSLSVPKELVYGSSVIHAYGSSDLYIHNYKGILDYTAERIRIHTKNGLLTISGKHLVITYYTHDEMKIEGQMEHIEFGG